MEEKGHSKKDVCIVAAWNQKMQGGVFGSTFLMTGGVF